uniref:uncharacterized protein LOC124050319 isoform X2 n=1 Tax=Scatophagus argus TaxID=75038 RepID=UPI001ED7D7ED|nr:uncharacterized protein LOC124050319 isoform X2 [Scatophagus argus]
MSLILMLLLQFPAVTGQYYSSFVVGDGEEVTLPCDNRRADLHRCDEIDWLFIDLENRATVLLVKRGQIGEQAKTKSDRLSVTNSCSLVIKKVSAEDAGRYTCRQSGHQDVNVDLSVVTMTEREDADEVTLSCSVVTYERCGHTVKWLNEGEEVNEGEDDMKTSGSDCSVTVTLRSSFVKQKSKYREQFRCEVTDEYTDTVQQFTFRHQSSGEKPAVTGQRSPHFVVGDGEEVTLPCDNRRADLHRCDEIDWIFADHGNRAAVLLVERGQIGEQARTKSDRLSVTKNCSLVIKKVSAEDVGRYTCRQSGHQDFHVDLSVVTMTEREDADEVTLSCSVVTYGPCGHTVKWLNEGKEVNEGEDDMKTSGSDCSVTVTLRSSFVKQKSKYREQFRCEVTDRVTQTVQQFTFRHQSSGEKPVTGQRSPHFVVRDGEEVTLPCDNRRDDLHRCDEIDWLFADPENRPAVLLVKLGQIGEQARTKSDRLSVTNSCSLDIKKVSAEDVGRYICRQSGHQDVNVDLSVVTMTEREDADEVTLSCSVRTYGPCGHTVKWLNEGEEVNEGEDDMKTSGSDCSVTVTLRSSFVKQKSKYREQFKCEVTDRVTQTVQQFTFRHQSSGEKPGEEVTTTIATTTTTAAAAAATTTTTQGARTDRSVLDYMMLVLRVAELLLITLIAVLLIRAAGKQRPPDDNTVSHSVRRRTARRSGAAAGQVKVSSDRRWWCVQVNNDEDEDEGVVKYENFGETSASVSLH